MPKRGPSSSRPDQPASANAVIGVPTDEIQYSQVALFEEPFGELETGTLRRKATRRSGVDRTI